MKHPIILGGVSSLPRGRPTHPVWEGRRRGGVVVVIVTIIVNSNPGYRQMGWVRPSDKRSLLTNFFSDSLKTHKLIHYLIY